MRGTYLRLGISFQPHIGGVVARRALRGVSVRDAVRGVRIHVFHHMLHNHLGVSAGVLQAAAHQHLRVLGDTIRQAGAATGVVSLYPRTSCLRAVDHLRAGISVFAGDRHESALRYAGDMHGVHLLHDDSK